MKILSSRSFVYPNTGQIKAPNQKFAAISTQKQALPKCKNKMTKNFLISSEEKKESKNEKKAWGKQNLILKNGFSRLLVFFLFYGILQKLFLFPPAK